MLLEAVKNFGSPLYIYDSNKIKKQYERLISSFSAVKQLQINYAVKALSNISILKYIINLGSGIDAVSIQEVQLALKCGIKPTKIIFIS
jgi:diaminopimelate decarboxylase